MKQLNFIFNTNTVWDAPPRARHQLAFALASMGHKVTFIAGNEWGKPGFKKMKINENLMVFIPQFPISRRIRYRMPVLNEMYQKWLFPKLKKDFSGQDQFVICSDFGGYLVKNYFKKVIYFASDDYINNVKVPGVIKKYTEFTQKNLIKSSGFTIATAKKLVEDFSQFNPNSFELPLGAPAFELPSTSKKVKNKGDVCQVVLLGYIDRVKTPVELLNEILSLGYTELHLIGPIKDDILDHLYPSEKVVVHGAHTGESLKNLLMKMDVGIAPYYMEDANSGRTPNKMWQYLACGLPAVITNLPNVREWEFPSGTVYKADDFKEFVALIGKAFDEDSNENVKMRLDVAKNNTWEKRADLLIEYIKTVF